MQLEGIPESRYELRTRDPEALPLKMMPLTSSEARSRHSMSLLTLPVAIWFRDMARRLGLSSAAGALFQGREYEASYWHAMAHAIRPGDCVWDIGANCGYYTTKFAELAGASGHIVAFEPSNKNFARLRETVSDAGNVTLLQIGLSDFGRDALFTEGDDHLGATACIATEDGDPTRCSGVRLESGDDLVKTARAPKPNILKIDVEGHEAEVLEGLRTILLDPALRAVFLEMHFAILAARGRAHAPRQIEALLRRSGFDIRWTDPSHLHAFRLNTPSLRVIAHHV